MPRSGGGKNLDYPKNKKKASVARKLQCPDEVSKVDFPDYGGSHKPRESMCLLSLVYWETINSL